MVKSNSCFEKPEKNIISVSFTSWFYKPWGLQSIKIYVRLKFKSEDLFVDLLDDELFMLPFRIFGSNVVFLLQKLFPQTVLGLSACVLSQWLKETGKAFSKNDHKVNICLYCLLTETVFHTEQLVSFQREKRKEKKRCLSGGFRCSSAPRGSNKYLKVVL